MRVWGSPVPSRRGWAGPGWGREVAGGLRTPPGWRAAGARPVTPSAPWRAAAGGARGALGARGPGGSGVPTRPFRSIRGGGGAAAFLGGWAAHPAGFPDEETEASEVRGPAQAPGCACPQLLTRDPALPAQRRCPGAAVASKSAGQIFKNHANKYIIIN